MKKGPVIECIIFIVAIFVPAIFFYFISAERSSSGLLEFDSVSEALEGLAVCNHVPISNPSEFHF